MLRVSPDCKQRSGQYICLFIGGIAHFREPNRRLQNTLQHRKLSLFGEIHTLLVNKHSPTMRLAIHLFRVLILLEFKHL